MTYAQVEAARARTTYRPAWPISLDRTLRHLPRGRFDPSVRRLAAGHWWMAARTAIGPASLEMFSPHVGEVRARAWGDGAEWIVDRLPLLLGVGDDVDGFDEAVAAGHPFVRQAWRRQQDSWRITSTGLVMHALVQAILEQKVTGKESKRSWQRLLRDHGEVPPGPAPPGMFVMPTAPALQRVPSWWWRTYDVDHSRSSTIIRAAQRADAVQGLADQPLPQARRALVSLPGVGVWTVAEVAGRALGDADAVSVGDYHLAKMVGYTLTGIPDGTDEQMLELLAPYRGHRQRVIRLVESAGSKQPRRGPRITIPDRRPLVWGD